MAKLDEETNKKRGERVKKLLKEEKRSQKWLAEKLFLTPENLNLMLNGRRTLGEDKIKTIAGLFPNKNIRIGWLLGYEDYETDIDLFMGRASRIYDHEFDAQKLLEFAADLLGYRFELLDDGRQGYFANDSTKTFIEITEQDFEGLEDELLKYAVFLIEGLNYKKNRPQYSFKYMKEEQGIG